MAVLDTASVASDASCATFVDLTTPPPTKTEEKTVTPTNEDDARTFDPLLTPIRVPKLAHTQPPTQAPEDVEEANTSSFVHAACRLHEAMAVVTAECNELISLWTGGLSAQEVATSTATTGKAARKAETLQTLLSAMQLLVAVTGAMAGMALDARAQAVAHGRLRPLSAFADSKSETAATFAAYTGGTTATASTDSFEQVLDTMDRSVTQMKDLDIGKTGKESSQLTGSIGSFWPSISRLEQDLVILRTRAHSVYNEQRREPDQSGSGSTAAAARSVQEMMGLVLRETGQTANRINEFVKLAVQVADRQWTPEKEPGHWFVRAFGRKAPATAPATAPAAYNGLLQKAKSACLQANMAVKTVQERTDRAILQATIQKP